MIAVTDGAENRVKCVQCSKFIIESKQRYICLDCINYTLCTDCKPSISHEHEIICEKAHPEKIEREIRSGESVCAVLWPCLGYRELNSQGELNNYFTWLTYNEVFLRMKNFGFGLRQFVQPTEMIGICGRNSIDWYIAFFSCFINSIVGPVIPFNIGVDGLQHIVNHTNMRGLICDDSSIENALIVSRDCPSISFLIFIPNSVLTKQIIITKYGNIIKKGLKIYSFSEIERAGKKNNSFMTVGNTIPDDISTLIYTSGSTGVPKGVVITEKYARQWLDKKLTYGNYGIALRWSNSERETDLRAIVCGLRSAIYSRNMDLLFEDFQLAQPSSVSATPALWNKVYSEYKAAVNELRSKGESDQIAEEKALAKFSTIFGTRVEKVMTGGAPTSPEVIELMRKLFPKAKVYESYGASEVGAIATNGYLSSKLEFKLEDWENYSSSDLPYPRGELCIKREYRSDGYYEDKNRTGEVFIGGWYHTGDIIELLPNREIRIIDRKKSIFKLAQGEYVAPSRLEAFYSQSPLIADIYVHGNSLKSYLICVIHPKESVIQRWAEKHFNKNLTFDEILRTPEATLLFNNELLNIAKQERLRPHEIPVGIILTADPLLKGDDRKIMRHQLEKKFHNQIEETYQRLGETPQNNNDLVHENNLEVINRIQSMLAELGISSPSADSNTKLTFAGVDSLSAVKLRNMFKNDYKVDLPMNALFSENTTVESLSKLVTGAKSEQKLQFDIKKELEILDEIYPKMEIPTEIKAHIKSVLLTGVTGFLGTQILFEILTTRPEITAIYCLIRPSKNRQNVAPIDVIKSRFKYAKMDWRDEYDLIIKPVLGDVSQPNFGLSNEIYAELSDSVDIIYHAAAEVNSILPYLVLKSANVIGTQHVIDFAWTSKMKFLVHVSTTSACWTENYRKEIELNYDAFAEEFNRRAGAFGGYNTSKFVAEKLVYKALAQGLKAVIVRPGMISSSTLTGFGNEDDFDNRMLRGIIKSKSSPFFTESLLEMTPVDLMAKIIVNIGLQLDSGHLNGKIFNVYNPNRLNFDSFITTVEEITGLDFVKYSFTEWKETVLPKLEKDNPIVPLIEAYFTKREEFPQRNSNYDCSNTDAFMNSNGLKFPKINSDIIEKWVRFGYP